MTRREMWREDSQAFLSALTICELGDRDVLLSIRPPESFHFLYHLDLAEVEVQEGAKGFRLRADSLVLDVVDGRLGDAGGGDDLGKG